VGQLQRQGGSPYHSTHPEARLLVQDADRGFTRPTVLVLLPFRSHALAFLTELFALMPEAIEQVREVGGVKKQNATEPDVRYQR